MKRIFSAIVFQIFKWLGWKLVGDLPPGLDKAVMVVAPHTSNWDALYGIISIVFIKNLPAKFAVKKEAMFFPLGLILKQLGAIPIDRSLKSNTGNKIRQVDMLVEMFQHSKKLLLVIAPEGTRKHAPRWKTGFYHIAMKAQVPIVLGYLDYAKKEAGIGPIVYPTGNIEQDILEIQAFFKDKTGKYPHQGIR
jgi:1-acyl-sn-glycerol-3-phosphate acyltransferase